VILSKKMSYFIPVSGFLNREEHFFRKPFEEKDWRYSDF